MLRFVTVALFLAAAVTAAVENDQQASKVAEDALKQQNAAEVTGDQFAQGVAEIDHIDLTRLPQKECQSPLNEDDIVFKLHTREKPSGERIRAEYHNLTQSALNVKRPIKILIHAWLQDGRWADKMVKDYLYEQNAHVLVVDWSSYSKVCNIESTSKVVTPFVGKAVSKMLLTMVAYGAAAHRMHIVGFSHGAHMAGIAGKNMAPHLLARISGLDPISQPEFKYASLNRLSNGDAQFIDVIITSLPSLSSEQQVGDVTFYPNGGLTAFQPDCKDEDYNRQLICSHAASYKYFEKSIASGKDRYLAVKCKTWQQFLPGQCPKPLQVANMGEHVDQINARGTYFLDTNKHLMQIPKYASEVNKSA